MAKKSQEPDGPLGVGGKGDLRPWGADWSTVAKIKKKKKNFFTNDLLSLMEKKEERKATKYLIISLRNPY